MKFLFLFLPLYLLAAPGLEYTHLKLPTYKYFNFITGSQSIHILEVDPYLYEIKPAKALDDGLGRESVLSLNTRHGALASINGGFFSIGGTFDGRSCGTLKIDDWYALPVKPRGCVGWSQAKPLPIMDRLLVSITANDSFAMNGLNRPRKTGEAVLFTPCFHKTTLTNPDGEELLIQDGKIRSIKKGGSSKIPENGIILSIQEEHPLFNTFKVGDALNFATTITTHTGTTSAEEWSSLDYIVGGTPLLLTPHRQNLDFDAEQTQQTFITHKHACTAVGLLPNHHWLFVVVDKTTLFNGMTIPELTHLMEKLGCIYALNLDGGGSSTMVYENATVNSPRGDECEDNSKSTVRRVSDAILILKK